MNIIIILSNEFDNDLKINHETVLRANKGYQYYNDGDIIFTLGWNGGFKTESISEKVKEYLIGNFSINHESIISIPSSKDTVGDAFFSREYIEQKNLNYNNIYIVTSNWHSKRVKIIFDSIFLGYRSLIYKNIKLEVPKNLHEKSSLNAFYHTFDGVNFKELDDIRKTLFNKHPLYFKQY